MSKHPTSELSQRDIALMKYGYAFYTLLHDFKQRHTHPFPCKGMVKASTAKAREARNLIYRSCVQCSFITSLSSSGWKCSKVIERHPSDYACTCEHYKERRGTKRGTDTS